MFHLMYCVKTLQLFGISLIYCYINLNLFKFAAFLLEIYIVLFVFVSCSSVSEMFCDDIFGAFVILMATL